MGFLDELKKLTRPYDEDEDDYIDDAEMVDPPEAEKPRPNPFAGFGGAAEAASSRKFYFFDIYVNGEYVLTETLTPDVNASESEYAQAFLGLYQYKFYLVKGTAVGKTFSVDNIRFYCDLVPPAEQ